MSAIKKGDRVRGAKNVTTCLRVGWLGTIVGITDDNRIAVVWDYCKCKHLWAFNSCDVYPSNYPGFYFTVVGAKATASSQDKCSCDFDTVIMAFGCQCGGQ